MDSATPNHCWFSSTAAPTMRPPYFGRPRRKWPIGQHCSRESGSTHRSRPHFPARSCGAIQCMHCWNAGQRRLASALASNAHRPLTDQEALTLALFSKGQSRAETVASATGLSAKDAIELIEHCISAGWISSRRRITDKGQAELRGIRTSLTRNTRPAPELGKDEYYPNALRDHGNG